VARAHGGHAPSAGALPAIAPEAAEGGGLQEHLSHVDGVGRVGHGPGVDRGSHGEEGEVLYRRGGPDLREAAHHSRIDLDFCLLHQRPVASGRGHQEHLVELELLFGRSAVRELDETVAVSLGVVEHLDLIR